MTTSPTPSLVCVDLSDVDVTNDSPTINDRYRVAVDAYWRKTGLPCGSSLQWRPASHTHGTHPWRSDWGPVDASATGLNWTSYDYRVQPPRKHVWWRGPQDVIDLGVRYTRNGGYVGTGYVLTPTGMWFNVSGGSAFARWGMSDLASFEWSSDRHTWKACTVEVRS